FLLKIDRVGDIGRPEFRYKYQYVLGAVPVSVDRFGFYLRRSATQKIYRLDDRMYSLFEAMDTFNALAPEEKGAQRSWLPCTVANSMRRFSATSICPTSLEADSLRRLPETVESGC